MARRSPVRPKPDLTHWQQIGALVGAVLLALGGTALHSSYRDDAWGQRIESQARELRAENDAIRSRLSVIEGQLRQLLERKQ